MPNTKTSKPSIKYVEVSGPVTDIDYDKVTKIVPLALPKYVTLENGDKVEIENLSSDAASELLDDFVVRFNTAAGV